MDWLEKEQGLSFSNFGEFWDWSINDLESFSLF